jgi:transposase-like protein
MIKIGGIFIMAKYTNEFKQLIVEERLLKRKTLQQIEIEHGVLRSTTHTWVKRYREGTLFINKRTISDRRIKEEMEYEFLKKSFALLKEIRSK